MNNSIGDENTMGSEGAGSGYALEKGAVLGQYRIVRLLGRGGMGQVYEVEHTTLGRRYALKLLPEDFVRSANALERFKREAKVMANLEHPNVIRVDDFGETDGQYWLRMELAEGIRHAALGHSETCVTLSELAQVHGGKVPQEELVPILGQILDGLKYAHAHGAVHRDLKPSNILLSSAERISKVEQGTPNNEYLIANNCTAKIADFGLVKLVGEEWVKSMVEISVQRSMSIGDQPTVGGATASSTGTSTKSLLGTYEYMSPEQKRGEEADARSDIYSVGLMIYKLLTGEELGMRTPSQLDASLDKGWDELVLRALEPRPEKRFQNVAEMVGALPGFLATKNTKHTKSENVDGGPIFLAAMDSEDAVPPAKKVDAASNRVAPEEPPVASRANATRQDAASTIKKKKGKGWLMVLLVLGLVGGGIYFVQHQDTATPAVRPPVQQPQKKSAVVPAHSKAAAPQQGKVWTAQLGSGVSMDFMPIAAGSFMMGSDNGGSDEKPEHRVTLTKPFWMAKTEVTQAQYQQIMRTNPSMFKGADLPVEQVSWNEAMEFCRKLTDRERQAGRLPAGFEYTLPTEAQWEYACRAKTTGDYAGSLDAMGWYSENSGSKTCPVGTKQANAWGLCDMHGNVWEWCMDDWHGSYAGAPADGTRWGDGNGSYRVSRGGSWSNNASYCRSAFRLIRDPSSTHGNLGFRPLVLER
jgi:formylglycine-generating enzyme required for sulfatase activity/serine/threonine protein kinase